MIEVKVLDAGGSGKQAKVTERGQLVVAPLEFSEVYQQTANVINTAFNLVTPKTGKRFVITDILLYADKNVGVNDASVQIYEATSATSTTVSKSILTLEMLKNSSRDITGLNLITSQGVWLSIKTDDNTIYATLMGYYVDA